MPKGLFNTYRFVPALKQTACLLGSVSLLFCSGISGALAQISGPSQTQIGGYLDQQTLALANTPINSLNSQQLAQVVGNIPIASMSPQTLSSLGIDPQSLNLGSLGIGQASLSDLGIDLSGVDLSGLQNIGGSLNNLVNTGNLAGALGGLTGGLGGLTGGLGGLTGGLGGITGGLGGLTGGEQPVILPTSVISATLKGKCTTPSCATGHHAKTIHDVETHFRDKRHNLQDWMLDDFYQNEMIPALQAMTEQWGSGEVNISTQGGATADTVASAKNADAINADKAEITAEVSDLDSLCRASSNASNLPVVSHTAQARGRSLFRTVNANISGAPGSPSSRGPIEQSLDMLEEVQSRYCNPGEMAGALADTCQAMSQATTISADINFDSAAQSGDQNVMATFIQNVTDMASPESFADTQAALPEVLDYRGMMQRVNEYSSMSADSFSNAFAFYSGTGEAMPSSLQATLTQGGVDTRTITDILTPDDVSPAQYMQAQALAMASPEPVGDDVISNRAALDRRAAQNAASETSFLTELDSSLQRENRNMSALVGYLTRLRAEAANAAMLNVAATEADSE